MKRLIFLVVLCLFFVGQSKAYYSLKARSGHKYAFYKCGQDLVYYELQITIRNDDIYSYAAITAYFNNNTSKEIQLRLGKTFSEYKEGTITAPKGSKISKIKLAASGEIKTYISDADTGFMGLAAVSGRAAVAW